MELNGFRCRDDREVDKGKGSGNCSSSPVISSLSLTGIPSKISELNGQLFSTDDSNSNEPINRNQLLGHLHTNFQYFASGIQGTI